MSTPYPPPITPAPHGPTDREPLFPHVPTRGGGPPRRGRTGWLVAGVLAAVIAAAVGAGAAGVVVGAHLNQEPAERVTPGSLAPPAPEAVQASTVDLCTRFAAAYVAMPAPQNTGYDIIPTVNYISDALRDNSVADREIRAAMTESVRLMREQAAALSREPARGAVQPPALPWNPDAANSAAKRVWNLCRGYEG